MNEELQRVHDKINYETNVVDPKTFAVLLQAVKNNQPLKYTDGRDSVFPKARSDSGMQWDATKPDTHASNTLEQYGLVNATEDRTISVSDLGYKFLKCFDSSYNICVNNDYYKTVLLEMIFVWVELEHNRNIHPGRMLFKLMMDPDLGGFTTNKEFALWTSDESSMTDLDYENIKKLIINYRANPYDVKQKKAEVFLRPFANSWGLFNKKIENGVYTFTIKDEVLPLVNQFFIFIDVMNGEKTAEEQDDLYLSTEWFQQEATQLGTLDEEAEKLYKEFREKFAPDVLKSVEGIDLLHKIFLNETGSKDSLCYALEYDKRYSMFGSVAGGSAYKYGLFYSSEKNSWMTGSSRKQQMLAQEQAVELGTQIRNELVAGANIIAQYNEITELNGYADLYAKLFPVMPKTISKAWVMMYYHMLFPQLFPVFYNEDWQKRVLEKINIESEENSFIRMGQIALFVKQCGISNVAFSKIIQKIEANTTSDEETQLDIKQPYTFDSSKGGAQNKVVYGTPGCGKSYYVQHILLTELDVNDNNRIRTTFYQDYTNTDFVGQILPKVNTDKTVTYSFNPGPFALALRKAIDCPEKPVALIIEELNRGNAPSIFGDIFQLLDRDKTGKSQYSITNVNLQDYLNDCFSEKGYVFNEIYIPSNLYIIATMNTSDQNVFTLDTAFKRRWEFEKLRNKFRDNHEYKGYYIPGMPGVTWQTLVENINVFIVNNSNELSSEDKQLGVYFIDKETLCENVEDCSDEIKKRKFSYKLFEYLWDDVAKFTRQDWFGTEIKSLDDLIDTYLIKGKKVFLDGIISE